MTNVDIETEQTSALSYKTNKELAEIAAGDMAQFLPDIDTLIRLYNVQIYLNGFSDPYWNPEAARLRVVLTEKAVYAYCGAQVSKIESRLRNAVTDKELGDAFRALTDTKMAAAVYFSSNTDEEWLIADIDDVLIRGYAENRMHKNIIFNFVAYAIGMQNVRLDLAEAEVSPADEGSEENNPQDLQDTVE